MDLQGFSKDFLKLVRWIYLQTQKSALFSMALSQISRNRWDNLLRFKECFNGLQQEDVSWDGEGSDRYESINFLLANSDARMWLVKLVIC